MAETGSEQSASLSLSPPLSLSLLLSSLLSSLSLSPSLNHSLPIAQTPLASNASALRRRLSLFSSSLSIEISFFLSFPLSLSLSLPLCSWTPLLAQRRHGGERARKAPPGKRPTAPRKPYNAAARTQGQATFSSLFSPLLSLSLSPLLSRSHHSHSVHTRSAQARRRADPPPPCHCASCAPLLTARVVLLHVLRALSFSFSLSLLLLRRSVPGVIAPHCAYLPHTAASLASREENAAPTPRRKQTQLLLLPPPFALPSLALLPSVRLPAAPAPAARPSPPIPCAQCHSAAPSGGQRRLAWCLLCFFWLVVVVVCWFRLCYHWRSSTAPSRRLHFRRHCRRTRPL